MKYESARQLIDAGYEGPVWYVSVVVFNEYDNGDGTATTECVYWDDGNDLHPFECVFDNYQEAKDYAATFGVGMAMWTHANGNGPEYEHVSVDIVETEFLDGEYREGDARCMFLWHEGKHMQVIEFDENWKQIGVDD